jgi:EAL domain-containing protein (putative c-di-GMP-specific phosphodiesterase class I)
MALPPEPLFAQRRPVPEDLGRALLSHMAPWRPLSVSLHDAEGEALWLSGGSIGPDEHGYVASAIEVFTLEPRRQCLLRKLEDGRRALFLPARDPLGGCSGLAFVPTEGAQVDEQKVMTAAVRALMQRFSMLLAPPMERRAGQPANEPGTTTATVALPEDAPIRARSYTRLQQGGGTRRYEISIAPANAQHDAAVVERVAAWLAQNRQRYVAKPASFTIALSAHAATDPNFAQRAATALRHAELDEGMVLFSVPAAAWARDPAGLGSLLECCDLSGAHLLLDDFELKEAGLELLRHKAVRMLKIRAELTSAAMDDRYSRALLSSCLQIARVLGIHCVAKQVTDAATSRWLAGAGLDYVDSLSASPSGVATATGEAQELQQVS